jgi:hypothetical protein
MTRWGAEEQGGEGTHLSDAVCHGCGCELGGDRRGWGWIDEGGEQDAVWRCMAVLGYQTGISDLDSFSNELCPLLTSRVSARRRK